MEWLWWAQGGLNLALIAMVAYLAQQRKNAFDKQAQAKAQAFLTVLESRVEEVEGRQRTLHRQSEQQLRSLIGICDRAAKLVEQAQVPTITLSSTEEQKELLANRQAQRANQIPSVKQMQQEKRRIVAESAEDLRALLHKQLA